MNTAKRILLNKLLDRILPREFNQYAMDKVFEFELESNPGANIKWNDYRSAFMVEIFKHPKMTEEALRVVCAAIHYNNLWNIVWYNGEDWKQGKTEDWRQIVEETRMSKVKGKMAGW